MNTHPALTAGRVAVVTGGASGVGLAAAKRFAAMGMRICLADLGGAMLGPAPSKVGAAADNGLAVPTDVAKLADVQRLKEKAYGAVGEGPVLLNNAAKAPRGGPWG